MTKASETRTKLNTGAAVLEQLIRSTPLSEKTGRHLYEGRISVKEILRLSGIKSMATLHHAHHKSTKAWIDKKVKELKALAGRGAARSQAVGQFEEVKKREETLAEELAAAHYQILDLRRENALLRAKHARGKSNVVHFGKRRRPT